MRIIFLIPLCFVLLCLFSCKKKTTDDILADAHQYMQTRLDTVNLILDQITDPGQLKGEQQILYCRMKARCAGYVLADWGIADSLSCIALNHYKLSNDTNMLMNELLFISYTNINQEHLDEAVSFLTEFIALASGFNDNSKIAYGNYLISNCYFREKSYDKALKYSKLAESSLDSKDTLNIGNYNRYIARIYVENGRPDSAMIYYDKALNYFILAGKFVGDIFDEIAGLKLSEGNYQKAMYYVELSLKNRSARKEIAVFNLTKARVFIAMNERDSARVYLQRAIESSEDGYVALVAYRYLSDLYKMAGSNEKAYYQMLNYNSLFQRQESELYSEVLRNEYQKVVLQNENNELKLAKKEREIYLLTITLIILIILVVLWFIYLRERRKKRFLEQFQREQDLEAQTCIAEKENQLLKQEKELMQLREKAAIMRESLFRKMLVSGKIPSLYGFTDTTKEDFNKKIHLNDRDWEEIIQTVNDAYNSFALRLKKEYPDLSVDDIAFCCLLKINVSMQDLADIYCISKAGITKKKTRMKKEKFKIEDNLMDLDSFLSAY